MSLVLCPPSFLTIVFIDIKKPILTDVIIVWVAIVFLNAALYGVVGAFITKYLRKSD